MATKQIRGPFGLITVEIDEDKQQARRTAIKDAVRVGAGAALISAGESLQEPVIVEAVDTGRRYAQAATGGNGMKVLLGLGLAVVAIKALK